MNGRPPGQEVCHERVPQGMRVDFLGVVDACPHSRRPEFPNQIEVAKILVAVMRAGRALYPSTRTPIRRALAQYQVIRSAVGACGRQPLETRQRRVIQGNESHARRALPGLVVLHANRPPFQVHVAPCKAV